MMRSTMMMAAALVLSATAARAQPSTERGYVSINGGMKASPSSFASTTHQIIDVETATVDTSYKVKAAPEFDVAGGVRVWRSLAIGADVSRFTKKDAADVNAQVPHPLYFGRPRSVTGNASGLSRVETALHLQAVWMARPARWELSIGGGPSLFNVEQDVVENVTVTQSYPYDTATFATAVSRKQKHTGVGFNVGADLTRMLWPHVGVGATAAFSRANVKLSSGADALSVDAGGAHVGGGVRFRF